MGKTLYADAVCVLVASACVCTVLEGLRPGLMSFVCDLSLLWVCAMCSMVVGIWFNVLPESLDALGRRYGVVSLIVAACIVGITVSLQFKGHLLWLGVVFILVGIAAYHIYHAYDSRR